MSFAEFARRTAPLPNHLPKRLPPLPGGYRKGDRVKLTPNGVPTSMLIVGTVVEPDDEYLRIAWDHMYGGGLLTHQIEDLSRI